MSLTVFDVTVRSTAIIVLSLIAFWLATRSRVHNKSQPLAVRVDNQRTNLYSPTMATRQIRTFGLIGLTSIITGLVVAVAISLMAAIVVSTINRLIGQ